MPSLAIQLAVLAGLEEPRSTIALAEDLDIAEVQVEEAVTGLEEAGLVEREGFGAKTQLVPVDPRLPRLAGEVRSAVATDAWQVLFGEERAQLAYVLDRVPRLELAAHVLDEPVETLRGEAFDLVEAGVLSADPFRLDAAVPSLGELLTEIDALRARSWARARASDAEVLWHLGPEILFRSQAAVTDPEVTYGGPALFADHGLAWEGPEDVYARTRRNVDASDAILQSLLACPEDEDVRAACRRLLAEEPTPTFTEKARIYGLEAEAEELRGEGRG